MKRSLVLAVLFGLVAGHVVDAQERDRKQRADRKKQAGRNQYPAVLPGATVEVYKTVGETKLNIYRYEPTNHKPSDQRPAIVFFFGGGWRNGSPTQFMEHCKYFASRGMVAMTADYRVASRHQVKAAECVLDAKSAVRWVRQNAKRLGVDPNRIVAGGGSAGGHLAACIGVIEGFTGSGEDDSVSALPNALVLFNPAVVLAPVDGIPIDRERLASLADRMGVEPRVLSPYHHIDKNIEPPTIIFHGKADTTVPYATAVAFRDRMVAGGNRCELIGYDDQPHGFFNSRNRENYQATVRTLDKFLATLGYLEGDPTIGADKSDN